MLLLTSTSVKSDIP